LKKWCENSLLSFSEGLLRSKNHTIYSVLITDYIALYGGKKKNQMKK
jgi:hypothetical protein